MYLVFVILGVYQHQLHEKPGIGKFCKQASSGALKPPNQVRDRYLIGIKPAQSTHHLEKDTGVTNPSFYTLYDGLEGWGEERNIHLARTIKWPATSSMLLTIDWMVGVRKELIYHFYGTLRIHFQLWGYYDIMIRVWDKWHQPFGFGFGRLCMRSGDVIEGTPWGVPVPEHGNHCFISVYLLSSWPAMQRSIFCISTDVINFEINTSPMVMICKIHFLVIHEY